MQLGCPDPVGQDANDGNNRMDAYGPKDALTLLLSPLPAKPSICSGNEEPVERTVRCANPVVVRAACLSLA